MANSQLETTNTSRLYNPFALPMVSAVNPAGRPCHQLSLARRAELGP